MTQDEILDRQYGLDFDASKSMRYHAYRRSFWQRCDYWAKAITILSGTAALVAIVGSWKPLWAELFAFTVAAFASSDIILGFSKKASEHDSLYRAFCLLRADIIEQLAPTDRDLVSWERRRLEIEMDEPGTLDWLERRCSAEEAKSRSVPLREGWKLPWYKVVFSQFSFWPTIIKPSDTQALR